MILENIVGGGGGGREVIAISQKWIFANKGKGSPGDLPRLYTGGKCYGRRKIPQIRPTPVCMGVLVR